MQPVDRLGAGTAELVAAVDQLPHHHQFRVDVDLDQVRRPQRNHRDRVRVDRVGLAAVAGGEHPHLSGQLRRHVHHGLAVVHQSVCDVLANPVAALDRPDPIRVLAAGRVFGSSWLIGMKNLVAGKTSSRRSLRASPAISSDAPAE